MQEPERVLSGSLHRGRAESWASWDFVGVNEALTSGTRGQGPVSPGWTLAGPQNDLTRRPCYANKGFYPKQINHISSKHISIKNTNI